VNQPPPAARVLKPAVVRFYFDADLMGVGKLLAGLRSDVTHPGDPGAVIQRRQRPPCPIKGTEVLDSEWIPVVAEHGWVAITRDLAISRRPAEREAVRVHGARLVALVGADATTKWSQLETVMINWRAIEALCDRPGPFIYAATRSGKLRPIDLDA
jgi:PIN like domain